MNTLKNKVQLIGNLGRNPEIKTFDSGKIKAGFSLATSETYKKENGEKVTETQWHNIVAWGPKAKFVEKYLKKGNEIAMDGKLTSRTYEDKEGNTKYITEVVVNDILLLKTGKKEENTK
ncbi:MAG: single-stranded DNA-binding protein [Chlorobi bacterium]|nr:single-stranded DNA-binding protein [Chlorobiota bacterium]